MVCPDIHYTMKRNECKLALTYLNEVTILDVLVLEIKIKFIALTSF